MIKIPARDDKEGDRVSVTIEYDFNGYNMLEYDQNKSIIKLKDNIEEISLYQAYIAGKVIIKVVLQDDKLGITS